MKEDGSTRKLWKELSKGQNMLVNVKSREGRTITHKTLMIEDVIVFTVNCDSFYSEL